MDQRTLVMTSGPEELPYQPNDLFESDFSNAVAQVNFDLNSEPCLGGLSSGYEVEKGSWGQPWPAGEDKLSSHLPTKAQCESLDLFCSDLSNPGCPLFSTISNELFAQEGDLSTSSLEFNSGVLVNSGMAQATQGHVKIDTDQSSFVGYNPDELDNLFRAEPFLDSKSKVSSSRLAELSNGEPFEELEVSPERPDCDEKATNVEENNAQSMMDVDPTEPTKKDQLFLGNDDDRITWTQVDNNYGPIDIPAINDADKLPTTNDAEDHDRLTNDDNERGTSNDMDELANEEYNEIANEGADAPDMMEQDPPPSHNPENDMSIPQSPLNPGAIENTSPLRENSEALSGLTSSPTEETITEPTEVGGPTPLSDEEPPVDAISLTHSQQTCMFHPVVIIELTEPVKPTSDFFRCATCKHSVENADLLIEHHFNCHSASSRKDTPEDVPNASPPPSLSPVKKEKFKGPYTCKKCHITFTKINPYVRHMREHTGKTPYVCEICGRYFAQAGGVRRHQEKTRICNPLNRVKKVKKIKVRASLGETSATEVAAVESAEKIPECQVKLWKISKVHECTYCHKTFLSRVKAKKHQYNLHKGATPSPIVTKVISNEKTPSQEPEYTFKCPICPRFFKYSFNRGRHLRKCVKQKILGGKEKVGDKYRCPLCFATFSITSNRYRHIKKHCVVKTLNRLSKEEFKSPSELEKVPVPSSKSNKHKGESESKKSKVSKKTPPKEEKPPPKEEKPGDPKYKCRFCPAVYRHITGLYRHVSKHRRALLTGGTLIYKKSQTTAKVVNDEDGTKSKASLRCRICRKHYSTLAAVRAHELIHKGGVSNVCSKCGSEFKNPFDLLEHKGVHQGKVLCRICLKILPTIKALIRHTKVHHKTGSYRCPDCLKQFKNLIIFVKHLKSIKIEISEPLQEEEVVEEEDRSLKEPSADTDVKEPVLAGTKIKCDLCQAEFPKRNMLAGHRLGHKLNSLIECEHCGWFLGRKRIQLHIMTCHNKPPPPKVKRLPPKVEGPPPKVEGPPPKVEGPPPKVEGPPPKVECPTPKVECPPLKVERRPPKVEPPVPVAAHTGLREHKCHLCFRIFTKKYYLERHLIGHKTNTLVICNGCDQYFGTSKLERHKQNCRQKPEKEVAPPPVVATVPPSRGSYPCTICPRLLTKKDRLQTHIIGHKNNTLTVCPLGCGQYYWYRKLPAHQKKCTASLESQINIPAVVPPLEQTPSKSALSKFVFKCQHCPKQFRYKSILLRHSVTHSGVQPYPCSHCGKRFPTLMSRSLHKQMCGDVQAGSPANDDGIKESCDSSLSQDKLPQKGDSKYKCTFCNKCFLKPRSLRNHILSHNEAKPYRCKSCGVSFSRFDRLKTHQANCKVEKMRLEICIPKLSMDDIGKDSKTDLDEDPEDSGDPLQCKFCFKKFPILTSLQRHFKLFHSVKRFECEDCGSTFSHKRSVKLHQRKYCKKVPIKQSTGILAIKAAEKPLRTLRNVTLKRPLTEVESPLTSRSGYRCTKCSLPFANSTSLKNHMVLHSNLKPFVCQYCGEGFPRKDYLQRHYLKCTELLEKSKEPSDGSQDKRGVEKAPEEKSDQGFSCAYCSTRFSLFSQLQEHFLNVHQLETADQPATTASLQHHLSNMPGVSKDSERQLNEKPASTPSSTLDTVLTVEASQPPTCGMNLKNTSAFQAHLHKHSNPYFDCNVCGKGFWNKMLLRKHKRRCRVEEEKLSVADSKPPEDISTITPPVVLSPKSSPERPVKVQKDEVRYQCSECHKSFTDGLVLITHLEDHRREELEKTRHKCAKCGKICGSQENLEKHMRIHFYDKTFSCPECAEVLTSQSELDIHMSFHGPSRAYACKLCPYRFNSGPTLCAHYAKVHPNDMFTCRFCQNTYSAASSLARHYKKHHRNEIRNEAHQLVGSQHIGVYEGEEDDDENEGSEDSDSDTAPYFPCHVCGKTFKTSQSLEDHQRCHLGEKPHECEECGKCFFLAGQLEHHMRMHKSEFQCQLCGKGFVSQFALRKHKNTHGKSRAHRCTVCQLTFTGAPQLAEHMASHREENFPCDICDLVFNSKSSRFEHRKTHTSEMEPMASPKKPKSSAVRPEYQCGDCNERFTESEALLVHSCGAVLEQQLNLKKEMDHSPDFICSICNLCCADEYELSQHFSTHSSEIFVKKEEPSTSVIEIKCSLCNGRFPGSKAYESHVCSKRQTRISKPTSGNSNALPPREDEVDVTSGDLYNCTDCPISFSSQSALLEHHTIQHNINKPFKCPTCPKSFALRRYLQKHRKKHCPKQDMNGKAAAIEATFRCDQCGESVASEHELSLHMSQHVDFGEGDYNCDLCLESFDRWSLFKRHQESHMGQVVYECDECDKAFAYPDLLEEHQKLHALLR